MRRILLAVLVLAVAACGGTETAAQGSGGQTPGADTVVAEIGARKITLKDVDEKWQSLDPAERARVTQLLYQNRRTVIEQMIGDLLIDEAAKAAGLPAAQYREQEMKKRQQPVTEADLQQFFDANKDRAQGRTIDQLRAPIREYLEAQREQQGLAALVDDLKKRGPAVRVMLDPPRQRVDVAADDPSLGPASAPVTVVEFSDYQ